MVTAHRWRVVRITLLLLISPCLVPTSYGQASEEPRRIPAEYTWDGTYLELRYGGRILLKGRLENPGALEGFNTVTSSDGGKIDQVLKWVSRKEALRFTCEVVGSPESFPCESERREDAPLLVRHSVGLSRSLLNRAVYDRRSDWLLSADVPTSIVISPLSAGPESTVYRVTLSGRDILLRFRPWYYRKFKGLEEFRPWTYRIWDKSIAGWVSWFAYFRDITEENVKATADVLSEVLLPYGLQYLQIDDGYQQTPVGIPSTWLIPNKKFASGLQGLSGYIRKKGLKPGIWTNVSFYQKEFVEKNTTLFVRDEKGKPAFGNWIGYVMDGSNPQTIDSLIRPVYRGLRSMGWQYFKLDALRHLRYEGYNSYPDYFLRKGVEREKAFRTVVASIREELGPDNVLMGCWGIRPELAGLIDACRIGDDGFGYGGLAQYNSFNNVVWRNDPDHIQLTAEEAYRSCMVTSLTGSVFMLTDRPEVYRGPLAEPPRRCLPVLFTRPGQVYDVEPSRSDRVASVETELSGAGPRPVDADQQPYCNLYLLELNTPFESWVVLGRLGGERDSIRFADLGLKPEAEYLAFEYWSRRFMGSFRTMLPLEKVDAKYRCQAYCVREKRNMPQIIATSRHISCGAADLRTVCWSDSTLTGESELVQNDPYTLYITEPEGYSLMHVSCDSAQVVQDTIERGVRSIQLRSEKGGTVRWSAEYIRSGMH